MGDLAGLGLPGPGSEVHLRGGCQVPNWFLNTLVSFLTLPSADDINSLANSVCPFNYTDSITLNQINKIFQDPMTGSSPSSTFLHMALLQTLWSFSCCMNILVSFPPL